MKKKKYDSTIITDDISIQEIGSVDQELVSPSVVDSA